MRGRLIPGLFAAGAGSLLLAACSPAPVGGSAASATTAASVAATTPAPHPPPGHHWNSREGQEYAYVHELTDDEKKAGKAAEDVSLFRYMGVRDGAYTIVSQGDQEVMIASCVDPCQIVKLVDRTFYSSETRHIAFNEDSVVGAALSDAMNGQMEIYQPPAAAEPGRSQGAGRASDPSIPY